MPPEPPEPQTLLDWLARRYPMAKRQTLRRMIQAGRVRVNGRLAKKGSQAITPDDAVLVSERMQTTREPTAPAQGLRVIYEDSDLLLVDKPAGLLTSTVPRERRPTLLAMVRRHVQDAGNDRDAPVGLIHRLDRDATGLLIFSKSHDSYRSLKQQFFDHTIERVYTAVVHGVPQPRTGRIESRLMERADGSVYSTRRPGEGEYAATEYEVVEAGKSRSVVRVKLFTGRKHQIRVHLSERGTPIVGDPVYTHKATGDGEPLHLAATKLSLTHPRTGQRLTFELPRPKWAIL